MSRPLLPSRVEGVRVVLTLADPTCRWTGVRPRAYLTTRLPEAMQRVPGGWRVELGLPDLDRLEYQFEATDAQGKHEFLPDPDNPRLAGGSLGSNSWLPMPGYAEPAWLAEPTITHDQESWGLLDTAVGDLHARVWSPADSAVEDDLPMLLVHDGPELAAHAGLTHYLGAGIAAGRLPRMRVVLLESGDSRAERFSANRQYAEVLVQAVEVLRSRWPSSARPVLLGTSLGALAALHASWRHPGVFAGLWLGSGSFFTSATDPGVQESFELFAPIAAFTSEVARAEVLPELGELAMVCGTAEENIANNLSMRDRLRSLGAEVAWGSVRDGHNNTCWRDLLDPHLAELLRRTWDR